MKLQNFRGKLITMRFCNFSYSHEEMANYYKSVNDWFTSVIQNAPPQLRNGFFLSHLAFYDVQNSLLQDTLSAIGEY